MTNHPIHMHGYDFKVTGTDGGWVPEGVAWPEVSIDVAVGQMRAFEFVADVPGDWALHCHKSHHTMNAMGHNVRTYIGVNMKRTTAAIRRIAPGYMPMGASGMGEMGSMEMPLPENTLPMMTGYAQFGPVEMGGMFTVVKVRPGLAATDYSDPGWYKHPEGTVAYEWTGEPPSGGQARARTRPKTKRGKADRVPRRRSAQASRAPRMAATAITDPRSRLMEPTHEYIPYSCQRADVARHLDLLRRRRARRARPQPPELRRRERRAIRRSRPARSRSS